MADESASGHPERPDAQEPDEPATAGFDRFQDLTGRLLRVPKSELEAKRKAEAKAEARLKAKTA